VRCPVAFHHLFRVEFLLIPLPELEAALVQDKRLTERPSLETADDGGKLWGKAVWRFDKLSKIYMHRLPDKLVEKICRYNWARVLGDTLYL